MNNTRTSKRWSIEEMMRLYTLIEEKNGNGLDLFVSSHPWRTKGAARKRYSQIKSGKINVKELNDKRTDITCVEAKTTVNVTVPDKPEEILFDIEDYEPFRPNIFVRFLRFIKRLFKHNE